MPNFITPEMLKYEKKGGTCPHTSLSDFSFFASFEDVEKTLHTFCHYCRCHWFKGRKWTPDEWDEYVNEG
jgi:hypothetical protein